MDGQDQGVGSALTPQTLEQKKEAWARQYSEIIEARVGKTDCVWRPADLDEWERLQDKLAEDKHPTAYLRELTLTVLLYPAREEMERLLQKYPDVPNGLCQKLKEIGGGHIKFTVKKG